MGKRPWRQDVIMTSRPAPVVGAHLPAAPAAVRGPGCPQRRDSRGYVHGARDLWMTGVDGLAEEPVYPKNARFPGPLPVRSSGEQERALECARKWHAELGAIDLGTVSTALKEARLEAECLGLILAGDQDGATKKLALVPADISANVELYRAAGEECMRRARSAAIKASFELGLVKKLLATGWLPADGEKLAVRHKAHCEAVRWWRDRATIRSRRAPLSVKGSPRVFVRNSGY